MGKVCLPPGAGDSCTLTHATREGCCWCIPALWSCISLIMASPLLCATTSCPIFALLASHCIMWGQGVQKRLWRSCKCMRYSCCDGKNEAGVLSFSACGTWQVCVYVYVGEKQLPQWYSSEIFWLVPRQKPGICNLGVKEPEKAHTASMIISHLQDAAAAALVGRKLLRNSIAVFLQGIKNKQFKNWANLLLLPCREDDISYW